MTVTESPPVFDPVPELAKELKLGEGSVRAVARLLKEGATVPFIARYRKESTGGLDEVQIRSIEERQSYLVELEARRGTISREIESQGKLTAELRGKIAGASTKAELEDLYLPFKPKRRTRATIAKERGLEPLAELILAQGASPTPARAAQAFVKPDAEVPDEKSALAGARDICAERIAEDSEVRKFARENYFRDAVIRVTKTAEHAEKVTKFDSYADFSEAIAQIPSHRFLAIRRGESESVLRAKFEVDPEQITAFIERRYRVDSASPWAPELRNAIADAVQRLLLHAVEIDVRVELKLKADQGAIEIFAQNLRQLLLGAPFGEKTVLGIDPGQRTGCKCAVVDNTGKLLEHTTLYLVQGEGALAKARETLRAICKRYSVQAIAVGNGTHGRETESFVRSLLREEGLTDSAICVSVNEAGASVYSASELAREEFPELDLTIRGAISIARRLQDPLAELVKIDPKSIGVGQYQHDVFQPFLAKKLDEVVESCVNNVGVELNTASASLLSRVAGIGASLAKKLVSYRNDNGAFKSRRQLLEVPGLGPRTFEQAAGFLRVRGGEHPLDASAVHPERYALVERMARDLKVPMTSLIGDAELLRRIDPERYVSQDVGSFTLNDILSELAKPGRDPRATFEAPCFRDDVSALEDLRSDMVLEGVVTNVTAFGAFVDIGVHQDGLVHVSELSERFVRDPKDVVKVGDRLKVRVLEVDLERRRVSLSVKRAQANSGGGAAPRNTGKSSAPAERKSQDAGSAQGKDGFRNNPFANHFRK